MNKNILLIVSIFFAFSMYSQDNLIQNSTFEINNSYNPEDYFYTMPFFDLYIDGWESQHSYVAKYKQKLDLVKYWHKVPKDEYGYRYMDFHSPDRGIDNGIGNVAGIGHYELLQQQLLEENKLEQGKHYLVSFDVKLPTITLEAGYSCNLDIKNEDSLVFYMSKKRIKYKKTGFIAADGDCYSPEAPWCYWETMPTGYSEYEDGISQDFIKIGSFSCSNLNVGDIYNKQFIFTAPNDGDLYDWFVMDVNINSTTNPERNPTYVLIGNISLVEVENCNLEPCLPTDGEINASAPYPNPNFGNSLIYVDGLENVYSATYINIYDQGGGLVTTLPDVYSINGIYNPLSWDAKYSGGSTVAAGYYHWSMILANDCGIIEYSMPFGVFEDIDIEPEVTIYNNNFQAPRPCCPNEPDIYLQDVTLSGVGELKFIAQNNIYIENVTIENTLDYVLFQAGNAVYIDGTFTPNDNFDIIIESCGSSRKSVFENKEEKFEFNDEITDTNYIVNSEIKNKVNNNINEEIINQSISIVPNPNTGSFQLDLTNFYYEILKIEFLTQTGSVFYSTTEINNLRPEFDFTLSSGLYFVKIYTNNRSYSQKFVVE